MKACLQPDEKTDLEVQCMKTKLELVNKWKVVGVAIDEHVDLKFHISKSRKTVKNLKGCTSPQCGNDYPMSFKLSKLD